jgi:LacI family transcriptional regulator
MSYPTIYDVAREANVGAATVSRVLNGGSAPPATHERVRDAAKRLGYIPSRSAQSLRRTRTMTLGAVFRDLVNPLTMQMLRGVEQAAQGYGYSVLISDVQDSDELQQQYLARLFEHRVDGLILSPGLLPDRKNLERFSAAGTPIEPYEYDPSAGNPPDDLLARLERGAAVAAFRYLVKLGHRRIAFFTRGAGGNPSLRIADSARLRILREVLNEADIRFDPALVIGTRDPEDCRRIVQGLAASDDPPTAYAAAHFLLIAPLLMAIDHAGLRIPDDVSFITFGDSDWLLAYKPAISGMRWDLQAVGRAYVERLVARIEQRPPDAERAHLQEPEFDPRASVGRNPRQ